MGVVRPLVQSSSRGSSVVHATNTATTKWARGMDMHLRGADEFLKSL